MISPQQIQERRRDELLRRQLGPQMLAAIVQFGSGRVPATPELRTIDPPGRRCGTACFTAA